MNRRLFVTAGAAALGALAVGVPEAFAARKRKFVPLYNGKDLTGWQPHEGNFARWHGEGELIVCEGAGGGWLTTEKEYGDFELRLDYKIPVGGNSGVGLRYPAKGDPAHEGMEIQILDDGAPEYKDLIPAQYTGGIYYQVAPLAHPAKGPGEWNHYDITCQGPHVLIYLNGVKIQDCDLDKEINGAGGHKPLNVRPRRGFVGLQSHTDRCEFKNIEIAEL